MEVRNEIVLLTPDDLGRAAEPNLTERARENVWLELGFFIARIGKDRVWVGRSKKVGVPSEQESYTLTWATIRRGLQIC